MLNLAARTLTLVLCAVLLTGCASWRASFQKWRLGLETAAAPLPVAAQTQEAMDRHYARGAAALGANDLDAAIVAWRQFVAIAPTELARSRKLRGYLTLLERESARRFAKQAAASEKSATRLPTDRLHVALFPFQIQGPATAGPPAGSFNRALMAMITVDLARVPTLTVLEREKIDHLLRELKLADSGLVDPATASAGGRLLGAGTVIAGTVYNEGGSAGPGSGRYKINTAVSDVAAGRVIGAQEADGSQNEFFRLQKRIVYGILESLQIKDFPASVHQIHTRNWQAYARFATGLKLLAEDRFDEAREAFAAALEFDADFALAKEAFLNTPEKLATVEEIQAQVRSGS